MNSIQSISTVYSDTLQKLTFQIDMANLASAASASGSRRVRNHPDFGNWPVYQKSQYMLFKDGKSPTSPQRRCKN